MIHLRKSSDRGHSQTNWLNSYHTFSFGDYKDNMGTGSVISPGEIQIMHKSLIHIRCIEAAEFLLFDLSANR